MKRIKLLSMLLGVVLVLILMISATLSAQVNKVWRPLVLRTEAQKEVNMPGGEGMNMVFSLSYAPSNPNVAYFVTDISGIWRGEWDSTIGPDWSGAFDENWNPIPDGLPDGSFIWESKREGYRARGGISLAVDPVNEDVVFVSGSNHSNADDNFSDINGIYRTKDGGESWDLLYITKYFRNSEGQHFVFDPKESEISCDLPVNKCHHNKIYAATHKDGLLRSIDGGDNWQVLTQVNNVYAFVDVSCKSTNSCGNIYLENTKMFDLELFESTDLNRAIWYNLNWQYRQPVSIDGMAMINNPLSGNLHNFPVLIKLSDSSNHIFDNAHIYGDDILFTTQDGIKINHEIEKYDSVGRELIVWVRIPELLSTGATTIYMYYGNAFASNQQNPEGVWDDNHVMVQHLNETSGQHIDSTANSNDSSYVYVNLQGQTVNAKIGGADEFVGTNYIGIPDKGVDTSLDLVGNTSVTYSAWIYATTPSQNNRGGILSKNDAGADVGYRFGFDGPNCYGTDTYTLAASRAGMWGLACSTDDAVTPNQWEYIVYTYDSSTETRSIYINGFLNRASTRSATNADSTFDLLIGRWMFGSFNGYIDEVRLSKTARTPEWIQSEYNNQYNPTSYLTFHQKEDNVYTANRTGIVLYLATENGLYKVEINDNDSIVSSKMNNLPDYPRTIALDSRNHDIIFSVGSSKLYKSFDGGQTFFTKNNGLPSLEQEYKIIDISSNDPNYLYLYIPNNPNVNTFQSDNGGDTWYSTSVYDERGLSLRGGRAGVSNASIHPDNPLRALRSCSALDRISETTDGGITWRYAGNGFLGGAMIRDNTAYFGPISGPDNRKIVFFMWDDGPMMSEDNGSTWRLLMRDASYPKASSTGVIVPSNGNDPERIVTVKGIPYAACIAISDNNGDDWTINSYDGNSYDENCGDIGLQPVDNQGNYYASPKRRGYFLFMKLNPNNTDIIYAGAKDCILSDNGNSTSAADCSWISRDRGDTWEYIQGKSIRSVFSGNGDIVYAFQQCSNANCISIEERPASCQSYRGNQALLWRSIDAGVTWAPVNCIYSGIPQLDGVDIDPADSNRLYASTALGFYIYDGCDGTEDYDCTGSDWIQRDNGYGIDPELYPGPNVNETKLRSVAVDPNNSNIVYTGLWSSYGQRKEFIYRSMNKGNYWEPIRYNLDGYANIATIVVDPYTSVPVMSTTHGAYALCTDNDADGYAAEGSLCGAVDCNDNNAAIKPGASDTNCNGIDENCSGTADEGYVSTATTCGIGECASTGQMICQNGSTQDTCTQGQSQPEVCDGLDNNCDGSTDENLTRATMCGVGACEGNTGVETCAAGIWGNDTCNPLAGTTPEICDNIDNDCNGSIDDNLIRPTSCGIGACTATGNETCMAGAWNDTCTPGTPQTEGPNGAPVCSDVIDNDCDGLTDMSDTQCKTVDLVETYISNPPSSIRRGNGFSVTDTVLNQGGTSTGKITTTRYYLSLDTVRNTGDRLLTNNRSVPVLAPGATSTGTISNVKVPSTTTPGTYYLLSCADDTKKVTESNETNNCIASSTTVQVTQ